MDTEKINRENALHHAQADAESAREELVQIPGAGHGQTVSRRKLERLDQADLAAQVARLEGELAEERRNKAAIVDAAKEVEEQRNEAEAKNATLLTVNREADRKLGWLWADNHRMKRREAEMATALREADWWLDHWGERYAETTRSLWGTKRLIRAALSGEGKVWERVRRKVQQARLELDSPNFRSASALVRNAVDYAQRYLDAALAAMKGE